MPSDSSIELLTVLQTRREYSRALLHLAQEQHELIEQDRMAELIQAIAKKQRVIELMNDLGRSRGGIAIWWRLERQGLPPDVRAACEATIADTELLLGQALSREQAGTDILTERRDLTQRELLELGDVIQQRRARSVRSPSPQVLDVSR